MNYIEIVKEHHKKTKKNEWEIELTKELKLHGNCTFFIFYTQPKTNVEFCGMNRFYRLGDDLIMWSFDGEEYDFILNDIEKKSEGLYEFTLKDR